MGFTTSLRIPDGSKDNITQKYIENRRRFEEGQAPLPSLIQVFAVKDDESEDEVSDPIL